MPKVSVIMPIYNAERYLEECLDSVLAQELEDIEVVCVDDGSTDGSAAMLDRYAAADPRVRVLHRPNGGYGAAMNAGIDAATGDYLGVVESDDLVDPQMFRRLHEEAVAHDADVCKCDFYALEGEGDDRRATWFEIAPGKELYGHVLDCTRGLAPFYLVMMTWEGIYRRSFVLENAIRHNETPGASFQDNGFWWQVFSLARRLYAVNEAHYYYRMDNSGSSIHSAEAALRIAREFAHMRAWIERDSARWRRQAPVFSYFYFDNLIARLSHVDEAARPDFARFVADEWLEYNDAGLVDRSLLPGFLNEELDLLAHDPSNYDPTAHPSIEELSWNEVMGRHGRTEILRDSISPYAVVGAWRECLADGETE